MAIKLTDEEKKFLWSKVEYRKKKKAEETKNEVYQFLNGKQVTFSEDEFLKILNSLEYTFRKKLRGFDKPMKKEVFQSIQSKLPDSWMGISYSSLDAKKKKEEREKKKKVKDFKDFNKSKKKNR